MDKVAIGVVMYNPKDINRFIKSLNSLFVQKRKIYLFDNSTKKTNINIPDGITYITENRNCGIAYALNKLMEHAEKDNYEWLITMDQDSILPLYAVEEYEKYTNMKNVGIICPQVIDNRRPYMKAKTKPELEYIEMCITSASCTSIDAWRKIGGFDEWLFIDLVDNEFCKRLRVSQYKILRLNNLVLNQEFGNIEKKTEFAQKFWCKLADVTNVKNLAKFSYKKHVDPKRVYYTNRNIIYVNRKLKPYGKTAYENYNCKGYIGFQISFNLPSFLRSSNKIAIIKAIFNGIKDGRKKQVSEWRINNE